MDLLLRRDSLAAILGRYLVVVVLEMQITYTRTRNYPPTVHSAARALLLIIKLDHMVNNSTVHLLLFFIG